MAHPWHYDEGTQVGTDFLDEQEVGLYDERMGRLRDMAGEAEEIRAALRLSSDSTVWEIGTGTGECALRLAAHVRRVDATDISPVMLSWARRKAAERGVVNVRFEAGGFLSGFRPNGRVDAVVSQFALHHLPDFWKSRALAAIAGKLRPGARFFLRDLVFPSDLGDYDPFFTMVVDGVRARAGEETAAGTVRHIRSEYSTLDWIQEGLLERAGFRIVGRSGESPLLAYVCERG
jgi:ubiquinone/menaquinone biosynthesis C-methylase UbiE